MSANINIKSAASLSTFRHLKLNHWSSLAEFIDNSLDSFLRNQEKLKTLGTEKCIVDIEISTQKQSIIIRDNAAGISYSDKNIAFSISRATPTPADDFIGYGMIPIACWYSDYWTVVTKAIDEDIEYKVHFDVPKIVNDKIVSLNPEIRECGRDSHYTVIELQNVRSIPRGNTLGKVKDFLARQFRNFINSNILEIRLNGEILNFHEFEILKAPRWDNPDGEIILWKKEFDFKAPGYPFSPHIDATHQPRMKGFIALLENMSVTRNGFDIFVKGRLINEMPLKYPQVFGVKKEHRYKRLFGEIHIDELPMTNNRDFRQEQYVSINQILGTFFKESVILKQADNFRKRSETSLIVDEILRYQRSISRLSYKLRDRLPDVERENLLSDLFDYSQSNDKIVPIPIKWAGLFDILRTSPKFSSDSPQNPCILGGYWTDYLTKRKRFLSHIYWAFEHNLIEEMNRFIRNLNYDDWEYCREISSYRLKKFTVDEINSLDID